MISGILFCIVGVCFFNRNAFETNKTIIIPVLIIIGGIILIAIGSAKGLKLID
jgi:uncharacterized membrane protein YkvI